MARIVRLTESELVGLVKRIVNEEELSPSADGKDCVQQIRKLYISNGFIDGGDSSPYSDWSGHHHTTLTYEKRIKNDDYNRVLINLKDSPQKDFQIEIGSPMNDPKLENLINNRTKNLKLHGLNCEMAKTELFKTIKPLEQLFIQMGYKKHNY
jgi:hypothetical protein